MLKWSNAQRRDGGTRNASSSQFLRHSVTKYSSCAMSTPRWQAVSSRSAPTDVSAHRSEGIKQQASRWSLSTATYSMHTLCTTHGRLRTTATCARNIRSLDYQRRLLCLLQRSEDRRVANGKTALTQNSTATKKSTLLWQCLTYMRAERSAGMQWPPTLTET